jgi:hypothetical protein
MLLVLLRLAVLLGVPVLLLIFLGTAGITSIIEAVVTNPEARTHITEIIDIIVQDERLRRTTAQMKAAMKEQPVAADSDDLARVYRFDLAQDSEMISPTIPI